MYIVQTHANVKTNDFVIHRMLMHLFVHNAFSTQSHFRAMGAIVYYSPRYIQMYQTFSISLSHSHLHSIARAYRTFYKCIGV